MHLLPHHKAGFPDHLQAHGQSPRAVSVHLKAETDKKGLFPQVLRSSGNEDNEAVKALVDVLKSDEIKDYINETYDGAVVPFEESTDDADSAKEETADGTADTDAE